MPDEFSPQPKPWKWIETHHWEVQFHGLPASVPWFEGDALPPLELSPGEPGREFPVLRLYEAVSAYLADDAVPEKDVRFVGFAAQIDLGNAFNEALERSDWIAAMGVLRDMERIGHECGYLEFNRAFLLGRTGDAAGARAAYRRGTELASDVEMLWAHYARTSQEAGDRAEASRAWWQCLRILPKHQQAVEALASFGELIVPSRRDQPGEVEIFRPEELREKFTADLSSLHGDAEKLRAFSGEVLHGGMFPDLALEALEEAVELDPDNAEGLRNCGVALRVSGRLDEALTVLQRAELHDPDDPWVHFHIAEVLIAQRDQEGMVTRLAHVLDLDPNHKAAIELSFIRLASGPAAEKEDTLTDWGKAHGSWRAFLIAADSAWKRGEKERAVRLAEEANKIAPEEGDVFLTYTGMLTAVGENEWVAALTRPRLGKGEQNPRAWMNYASALDAMGLREEAIQTLTRALAELTFEEPQARNHFENCIAHWSGCVAEVDVEIETHPGTDALRRSIFFVKDGKRNGRLFEAGIGAPNKRVIEMRLEKTRPEFDLLIEQQNAEEPFDAHNLGAFTVRGYDESRLAEEPLKLVFVFLPDGKLQCAPWQGERRIQASWNFVPPPRHESAEA